MLVRGDRPLIGVVEQIDGEEGVRYYADTELTAEEAGAARSRALALAGAWAHFDWGDMEAELDRIRHASPPTPPIDEV